MQYMRVQRSPGLEKHLLGLEAVFNRVAVIVIVEVSVNLPCLLRCFFHSGNPGLQLFHFVMVIVPWMLAFPMPSNISDVASNVDFGWQQRLVHNGVCHFIFF